MLWLFGQISLYLFVVAVVFFALGFLLCHYYFVDQVKQEESELKLDEVKLVDSKDLPPPPKPFTFKEASSTFNMDFQAVAIPANFDSLDPRDLKRIKGVGYVIEKKLNEYGIFQISEIASWSILDINRFNECLDFKGRIEREMWVEQAISITQRDQLKAVG